MHTYLLHSVVATRYRAIGCAAPEWRVFSFGGVLIMKG